MSRRKSDLEQLPPHDEAAEAGVLGCILLDPGCLEQCRARFAGKEVFYDLRHQVIYQTFLELEREKKPIDIITICSQLKKKKLMEECGGLAFVSALPEATPSAANFAHYAEIIFEKYEFRRIAARCTEVAQRIYNSGDIDLAELRYAVQSDLGDVFSDSRLGSEAKCVRFKISDLENFDLQHDPDNLVGNRYLTRGSSLIINGASGRGKSSLLMMRIILWALCQPFYGIKPIRPLTAVIYQTENNEGDLAAAYQGARNFLKLDYFENAAEFEMLDANIDFVYCPALCGQEFLRFAEAELKKKPRDIAVLDPLVSFPEGDLNSQNGAAEFLRKGLSKISFATNVTWVINHHTPKPLRDPKSSKGRKNISDYQYGGAGSFDIAGWSRAVETLEESSDGVFRLVLAKRGSSSGACHPNGEPTNMLWLRHATDGGIHWEQMDAPEEPEEDEKKSHPKGGKPNQVQEIAGSNLYEFCAGCTAEGEGLNAIARRMEDWLAKQNRDVSEKTCTRVIPLLVANGKLVKGTDKLYRRGPNA